MFPSASAFNDLRKSLNCSEVLGNLTEDAAQEEIMSSSTFSSNTIMTDDEFLSNISFPLNNQPFFQNEYLDPTYYSTNYRIIGTIFQVSFILFHLSLLAMLLDSWLAIRLCCTTIPEIVCKIYIQGVAT